MVLIDVVLAHCFSSPTKKGILHRIIVPLFFLLDNGDFLQGQPTVYFYNFVDTAITHLSARVMNYMDYDAGTVGNHDIEAGPAVYDKILTEFEFPWLAANAVKKSR